MISRGVSLALIVTALLAGGGQSAWAQTCSRQGPVVTCDDGRRGVLVLSKFAGAANELDTALLVNPHDIDGMARAIATAISMPLLELRMRYEAMMEKLSACSIQQWFADFIDTLRDGQAGTAPREPLPSAAPAVWPPLRSAGPGARIH